jgi:hypothetical protein
MPFLGIFRPFLADFAKTPKNPKNTSKIGLFLEISKLKFISLLLDLAISNLAQKYPNLSRYEFYTMTKFSVHRSATFVLTEVSKELRNLVAQDFLIASGLPS